MNRPLIALACSALLAFGSELAFARGGGSGAGPCSGNSPSSTHPTVTHSSGGHGSGNSRSSDHSSGSASHAGGRNHERSGSGSANHAKNGSNASHSTTGHSAQYPAGVKRDPRGKIERSSKVKHDFQKSHPCPSTGRTSGACPGYVVDHVQPLKRGGADKPYNMQWQTTSAAKAKDKSE